MWENACATLIDPTIKLQKRAVRTITCAHYLNHTESIFMELSILSIKKLVIERIAILMFENSLNRFQSPLDYYLLKIAIFTIIKLAESIPSASHWQW